ncbi:vicilin-like seed storage protein At2g18540 [Medicago truncatula]|uniref:vicilin-like seed storage protein At2g18540 n=1 Tax=Medicago truncatula TaxID=3880 RepID=UPI0019687B1E|nr:vicilin-like seed storage protein At2g18540 [Medicago truncatula]
MTDEEKSKPTTWVISGPTYTGKRRSGPKTGKLLIKNDRDQQKFFDSFYDEMIEEVRSCINKPDADLNYELFRLKTAWFGKGHYREYVAKNRKELRILMKKIKKKEAEILGISKEKEDADMKRKEEEEAERKVKEEAEILKKSKEKKEAKIQKKKMKKKEAKIRKQAAKKVCEEGAKAC